MSSRKRRLGRALSDMGVHTLLSDIASDNIVDQIQQITLEKIKPNAHQPRQTFKQDSLDELAQSIQKHGVIQPIVITKKPEGHYEIIAGERRYRASKLAGLSEIPAIVKDLDALAAESIAIIENIQREDLNPIDQAQAYARLIEVYQLSHDEIAKQVNKSRSAISNTLRLNKLHPEVKNLLKQGALEMGHARALLAAEYDKQPMYADKVVNQDLSVRQTEQLLKPKPQRPSTKMDTSWIVSRLKQYKFPAKVRGSSEKGTLSLPYESPDALNRILKALTQEEKEIA